MGKPTDTQKPPPADFIPLCVPEIAGNEWAYVKECLDTNWVSSVGSFVDRFEEMVARRVGAPHAVATTSGTSALHTALLTAGVEPDDEVLVSTLSFIAPANTVRYVGAHPVFVDCEPRYLQICPEKLGAFLDRECRWRGGRLTNRATGRRVRAVLPVHILGHPADMDPILEAARRYELVVVEDATEGLGALYRGAGVGNLADVGCFSFNGNKIITTGGGGMIVTGRRDWADRARRLTTQAKDDPVESVHGELGYNYRPSNLLAAVGCAQMERLDEIIASKRRTADSYAGALGDLPGLALMAEAPWARSTFWMYTVRIDEARFGTDSRALLRRLEAGGIQSRPLWQPLHRSPVHRHEPATDCSTAERVQKEALSLPCSAGIDEGDLERVQRAVREAAGAV